MVDVSIIDMLKAGTHFGHQKRYWNPKMYPYIYGDRNRVHIINLEKTLPMYREATNFLGRMAQNYGRIMFVGSKPAAQEAIAAEATRCKMPYVNQRWLGGTLTNFRTIKQSIKHMFDLERTLEENIIKQKLYKKELLKKRRELAKLENNLGGIRDMASLPDVLFVIDVGYEKIAIGEAIKLGIPIVGIVDTNNSPSGINYVIPGNDDSTRAIQLYLKGVTDAILDGLEIARAKEKQDIEEAASKAKPHKGVAKPNREISSDGNAKKHAGNIVPDDKHRQSLKVVDDKENNMPSDAVDKN